jgi:hypothetical protein
MNREKTISDVLLIIAEKNNIREMRHQIIRLANRLNAMNLPILYDSYHDDLCGGSMCYCAARKKQREEGD